MLKRSGLEDRTLWVVPTENEVRKSLVDGAPQSKVDERAPWAVTQRRARMRW